jgi:hypothetical protein
MVGLPSKRQTTTLIPDDASPPATNDQFAKCGHDEAGIEGSGGELNLPFGTHPYCCGNSTWSSFSWRAKASPNVPVSADLLPASGSGRANASECLKHGQSHFDCFIFYFNASKDSQGGGTSAGYDGNNYPDTRAAGEWTSWRDFEPGAATADHDGTMPASGGTVATYHCSAYPNFYIDPIRHLVLPLTVRGVYTGNMSTITLEVKPGGAKAGQDTYQINATVSSLSGSSYDTVGNTSMSRISLPFVVSRENLTRAEGGGKPLITAREKHAPLWAALPKIAKAPKKIIIKQGYHGGNDMGGWIDAATALVGMGASALSAPPSAGVSQIFKTTGVAAAGLQGGLHPYATSNVDHAWGSSDAEVAANLAVWAEALVGPMRAVGFTKLTQFALHDELSYDFAAVGVSSSGPNNITGNPRVFQRFHNYIRNMSGLTTPADFGATTWGDVVPITRDNITTGSANEQGMRARFVWTMRFVAWDVVTWYAQATAALVTANSGEAFSIYTNWVNVSDNARLPACLNHILLQY